MCPKNAKLSLYLLSRDTSVVVLTLKFISKENLPFLKIEQNLVLKFTNIFVSSISV